MKIDMGTNNGEELGAAGLTWNTAEREPNIEGIGEILCKPYVPHLGKKRSKWKNNKQNICLF